MPRRDRRLEQVLEPLEPRRHLSAGDVIDTDTLAGRSQATALELVNMGDGRFYAFTSGLNGNVSVARINFDGTLDTTFGDDGWVSTGLTRTGIGGPNTVFGGPGSDGFGMIYNSGGEVGVAVFDAAGNPDTDFSDDGRWQADFRLERVAREGGRGSRHCGHGEGQRKPAPGDHAAAQRKGKL